MNDSELRFARARSYSPATPVGQYPFSRATDRSRDRVTNRYMADDISRNYPCGERPERSNYCKVASFDGSEDIDDYLVQFEIAAAENRWNSQSMARQLSTKLRGQATSILTDMSYTDRNDYDAIVEKLRARFQPGEQCALSREKLRQRFRKQNESLVELGAEIKRLSRKAYPRVPDDVRDDLAVNHFLDSINDSSLRAFIEIRDPKSVDAAVRAGIKSEKTLSSGSKQNRFALRMQYENSEDPGSPMQRRILEQDQKLNEIMGTLRDIQNVGPTQDRSHTSNDSKNSRPHTSNDTNTFRSQTGNSANTFGSHTSMGPDRSHTGNRASLPSNLQPRSHTSNPHHQNAGFNGKNCWNCNQRGHVARECRYENYQPHGGFSNRQMGYNRHYAGNGNYYQGSRSNSHKYQGNYQ